MREILFKGKRIDGMGWIEGYYANCCYPDKEKDKTYHFIVEYPDMYYEIFTNTLGQYTGLTDKNGKKIYEGDIVKYQFDNDDCPFPNKHTEKIIGRIFFSDFRASFSVTAGRNGSASMNNDLFKYVQNGNRVEVIGNIYDNPELLEVVE